VRKAADVLVVPGSQPIAPDHFHGALLAAVGYEPKKKPRRVIVSFARALVERAADRQLDIPAPRQCRIDGEIDIDLAKQHRRATSPPEVLPVVVVDREDLSYAVVAFPPPANTTDQFTVIVPAMPVWIVQWYGNEPAAGNTCTNIWPEGKPVLNDVPSSEVTVCEKLPLFCQHTDCPCVMVTVLGENTLESVALTFADAPLLPHELAGAVELPPQAVVTTSAIPRASMVRMRSLLGRSERCMAEDVTRLGW